MTERKSYILTPEQVKFRSSLEVVDRHDFVHLWTQVLPQTPPTVLEQDPIAQMQLRDVLVQFANATKREKDPPLIELFTSDTNDAGRPGQPLAVRERVKLLDEDHTYLLVSFGTQRLHDAGNLFPKPPTLQSSIPADPVSFWRVPNLGGKVEEYTGDNGWKQSSKFEFKGLGIGNIRAGMKDRHRLERVLGKSPIHHR